jgi:hypothetical protein
LKGFLSVQRYGRIALIPDVAGIGYDANGRVVIGSEKRQRIEKPFVAVDHRDGDAFSVMENRHGKGDL